MATDNKICKRCVMDTTDPGITFDENGICNHCKSFEEKLKVRVLSKEKGEKYLADIVKKIKNSGRHNKYDCIIGVSGGLDSTYVAYTVKKLGLRPLAVHFDNGWDSELAVSNIEKILRKLNIDLFTYVIDWEVFRNLQLSFLKASTPDGEIPTDHAIITILYEIADRNGIKYIITGANFRTEGIMPVTWAYGHLDWKYIKKLHDLSGTLQLKGFPHLGLLKLFYFTFIKGIKLITILSYIDFDKKNAMQILEKELAWKYYGGKHYESIYTRFYQSYLLPKKFNIDKRKAHFSCLICSTGEITREMALEELREEPYFEEQIQEDKEYVSKKLGITEQEFENIMLLPPKTFKDYPSNYHLIKTFRRLIALSRKIGLFYR